MDEWRSEFAFWTTKEEEHLEALKAIIQELYPGYTIVSIQELCGESRPIEGHPYRHGPFASDRAAWRSHVAGHGAVHAAGPHPHPISQDRAPRRQHCSQWAHRARPHRRAKRGAAAGLGRRSTGLEQLWGSGAGTHAWQAGGGAAVGASAGGVSGHGEAGGGRRAEEGAVVRGPLAAGHGHGGVGVLEHLHRAARVRAHQRHKPAWRERGIFCASGVDGAALLGAGPVGLSAAGAVGPPSECRHSYRASNCELTRRSALWRLDSDQLCGESRPIEGHPYRHGPFASDRAAWRSHVAGHGAVHAAGPHPHPISQDRAPRRQHCSQWAHRARPHRRAKRGAAAGLGRRSTGLEQLWGSGAGTHAWQAGGGAAVGASAGGVSGHGEAGGGRRAEEGAVVRGPLAAGHGHGGVGVLEHLHRAARVRAHQRHKPAWRERGIFCASGVDGAALLGAGPVGLSAAGAVGPPSECRHSYRASNCELTRRSALWRLDSDQLCGESRPIEGHPYRHGPFASDRAAWRSHVAGHGAVHAAGPHPHPISQDRAPRRQHCSQWAHRARPHRRAKRGAAAGLGRRSTGLEQLWGSGAGTHAWQAGGGAAVGASAGGVSGHGEAGGGRRAEEGAVVRGPLAAGHGHGGVGVLEHLHRAARVRAHQRHKPAWRERGIFCASGVDGAALLGAGPVGLSAAGAVGPPSECRHSYRSGRAGGGLITNNTCKPYCR
ncbi:hypothetical protein L7F22_024115 [Adiantum nelumboides]|nr:hypothetical protein [Adiantum nelumboides]